MKKNPELTKRKIKDAFLELYEVKRIEQISIGEVTQKAGVYRGTFYYYYKDIYDLLDQIENWILDTIRKVIPTLIEAILVGRIAEKVYLVDALIVENESLFQLFLVKKPNYRLLQNLKEFAKDAAMKVLGVDPAELPIEASYLMEYIGSAQIGLLTMWLGNGREITTEKLGAIVTSANLKGPMSSLMEIVGGPA